MRAPAVTTLLLTGCSGKLGRELAQLLPAVGRLVAPTRSELDLTNERAIRDFVRASAPDVIVNAAAYTAVDRAETERALAHQVNAVAPGILAHEAARCGALLVHFSTDYVFDGAKDEPYTEADEPRPLNVYGRTKREGELAVERAGCAHLTLRTSWVYGGADTHFIATVLRLARGDAPLRMVTDQTGSPTWARELARATARLLADRAAAREHAGTYHLCAQGHASRHELAVTLLEMARVAGIPVSTSAVLAASTTEFPTAARRPRFCAMSTAKIDRVFGIALPGWQEQLRQYLHALP